VLLSTLEFYSMLEYVSFVRCVGEYFEVNSRLLLSTMGLPSQNGNLISLTASQFDSPVTLRFFMHSGLAGQKLICHSVSPHCASRCQSNRAECEVDLLSVLFGLPYSAVEETKILQVPAHDSPATCQTEILVGVAFGVDASDRSVQK
jgi:hypothetical protein